MQIGTVCYWRVLGTTDWCRLVLAGTSWYRLVQTGEDWYRLVQAGLAGGIARFITEARLP